MAFSRLHLFVQKQHSEHEKTSKFNDLQEVGIGLQLELPKSRCQVNHLCDSVALRGFHLFWNSSFQTREKLQTKRFVKNWNVFSN